MHQADHRLRVLTYNIQVGIDTGRYRQYLTRGWRHVLPFGGRQGNLDRIAAVLRGYDIVALQEIDAGSYRGAFLNQAQYLADRAGFPNWHLQVNRNYGPLARHGIAILSRLPPTGIRECRLPGFLPGRGALLMSFGSRERPLHVLAVHLSLGRRSRERQLRYLARLALRCRDLILLGDLNCPAWQLQSHAGLSHAGLRVADVEGHSYPSWRPRRNLDHVLVTPALTVRRAGVLEHPLSDHLPVAVELELPPALAGSLRTAPPAHA
ncbi:endonuclease/exonuclease/phosphatase family protein [Immundisolibacter sp.]|uniref:endonuclease/exonuclease/phosphatase family protein n=1 Tax=Immundisolibacter sp. TaxID=1934948 RepID=UPI00261EF2D4|nr:endonuclease/exonuclease/phosphatase family protein [Immundisolibacter sp.]MDD3651688.1 endonuclease/exonuclease/phosphatase family protein [Immundisolibacter sp.]